MKSRGTTRLACLGICATAVILTGTPSHGQPTVPDSTHYLTYTLPESVIASFPIQVADQFWQYMYMPATTRKMERLLNWVHKDGSPVPDTLLHYTWWDLIEKYPAHRAFIVDNQFGRSVWAADTVDFLLTPALKNVPAGAQPPFANHYLCYKALGNVVNRTVFLEDEFGPKPPMPVVLGKYFCNPCLKRHGTIEYPIKDPTLHLALYEVPPVESPRNVYIQDQFLAGPFWVLHDNTQYLAVPSAKILQPSFQDSTHYLTYHLADSVFAPQSILVGDQFTEFMEFPVTTRKMERLLNWVHKDSSSVLDTLLHYTWWDLYQKYPIGRAVRVSNQFGTTVWAVDTLDFLLTPALKNQPATPTMLPANHYLCYKARGNYVHRTVSLEDEFGPQPKKSHVGYGKYLCNPCTKYHEGVRYPVVDDSLHLALYEVPPYGPAWNVFIDDQFLNGAFFVRQDSVEYLAVPSTKDYNVTGVGPDVGAQETPWLRLTGPSPFLAENGVTFLYAVPQPGAEVSIDAYDVSGRHVASLVKGHVEPGVHEGEWRGADLGRLAAGVYFLKMRAGSFETTEKLVMMK